MFSQAIHSTPALTGKAVHDLARSLYAGDVGLEEWEHLDVAQAARDPGFHVRLLQIETYPALVARCVAFDDGARAALQSAMADTEVQRLLALDCGKGRLASIPQLRGPVYAVYKAPIDPEPDTDDFLETATEWDAIYVVADDRESALRKVYRSVYGKIFARPRLVMTEAQLRGCAIGAALVRLKHRPPTDPLE